MSDIGNGFFGEYGGRYVAEILRPAIEELDAAFRAAMNCPWFRKPAAAVFKSIPVGSMAVNLACSCGFWPMRSSIVASRRDSLVV